MKIIVKCWTPEWYDSVTHAVIDFDIALVNDLLEKLDYASLVAERYHDERFMGLEFDSYDPDFIDLGDPEDLGIDDSALDDGYLILPANLENHKWDETGMRPVMQMVMADSSFTRATVGEIKAKLAQGRAALAGDPKTDRQRLLSNVAAQIDPPNGRVYWYGFDKHGVGDCRAETYSLSVKDLRDIKEALQCPSTP